MKRAIVIAALLFPLGLMAQVRTFKWGDELCEFASTYEGAKYSEKQLKNTLDHLYRNTGPMLATDVTVFNPDKLSSLSMEALDKEYREKKAETTALDIVNVPFWQQYRQRKLRQLEQEYVLKKITLLSYDNPAVLKTYKNAPDCVAKYADALIKGGETLVAVWKAQVEEQCKHNGSPERLRNEFAQNNGSSRRLEYARTEVTTFGWWNCANQHLDYAGSGDEYPELDKEFRKLFIKTSTIQCDEP